MKRGYLLPEGCKDLIDVPKYKRRPVPPPITGEMTVGDQLTVRKLANVLKQTTPYQIMADLIEVGVLARLDDQIRFDVIAKVIRKYGYAAKKV